MLLDSQQLFDSLSRSIWREDEEPQEIADAKIGSVWKSPRRTYFLFDVDFKHADGRLSRQKYTGYIVRPHKVTLLYKEAVKIVQEEPGIGKAVLLIREYDLIIVAFPNDLKMKLALKSDLIAWLTHNYGKLFGKERRFKGWQITKSEMKPLRYIPGKRCTTLFEFRLENPEQDKVVYKSLIVKQFKTKSTAKKLYNLLKSLEKQAEWQKLSKSRNRLFPHTLGMIKARNAVILETLPGDNLSELLAGENIAQVSRDVGELLADFHCAEKHVKRKVTIRNELVKNRDCKKTIVEAFPSLTAQANAIIREMRNMPMENKPEDVLLHGSFRINHILYDHDKYSLIDVDGLRNGAPSYDIANLIAALYRNQLDDNLSQEDRVCFIEQFVSAYCRKSGKTIPAKRFLWYLTSLLLNKQSVKYADNPNTDGLEKTRAILQLAAKIIAIARNIGKDVEAVDAVKYLP